MGLSGKVVSQISIRSDGNVFHELFRYKTHKLSDIAPDKIEKVELERGQWGAVGSVIGWHFIHDGKKKFAREIVEAVDEKKKSITFSVIEGDLMEAYKTIKFIVDVEINGNQDSLVTWTIVYEKKNAAVPEPHSLINLGINLSKDIECHHLLVPN
ncbi:kirola [Phtheirospermum japonicum]|uniref:Kirola n=1 Tax=Phtheirospermum japonicum TaxID=374723 RepID=A0A830DIQ6_9LAMI|nr:kirola [Phtheirospermum japonicum]